MSTSPVRARRLATLVLAALLVAATPAARAQEPATVYRVRIADQRPPCADPPADLPIVPNDPGAITLPGGERRCYGTRPPEMELWLPAGRYVWLHSQAPTPAAWIDLGPVLVDPSTVEPPPLGLRVIPEGTGLTFETRFGQDAVLTPIAGDRWQRVESADGRTLWVIVEAGSARRSR